MSAGKGSGDYGGAEIFSDELKEERHGMDWAMGDAEIITFQTFRICDFLLGKSLTFFAIHDSIFVNKGMSHI